MKCRPGFGTSTIGYLLAVCKCVNVGVGSNICAECNLEHIDVGKQTRTWTRTFVGENIKRQIVGRRSCYEHQAECCWHVRMCYYYNIIVHNASVACYAKTGWLMNYIWRWEGNERKRLIHRKLAVATEPCKFDASRLGSGGRDRRHRQFVGVGDTATTVRLAMISKLAKPTKVAGLKHRGPYILIHNE